MDNMFKLMGWWTGIFAVLFFAGDMYSGCTSICSEHHFLPTSRVFKFNRAYVYVHVCQLFDGIHGWFQLLLNVYTRTRWPLISTYKKTAIIGCFFVYIANNCSQLKPI